MTAHMPISKASRTCSRSASTAPSRSSPRRRPRAAAAQRRHAGGAQGARRPSGWRRKITVRDGKYGPYVNCGKVNATLPKGKDPQSVTLEEALALIAETRRQGAAAARSPRRKAPPSRRRAKKRRGQSRKPRRRGQEGGGQEEGFRSWRDAISGSSGKRGRPQGRQADGEAGDFRPTPRRDPANSSPDNPDRAGKREIAKAFGAEGRRPHLAEGPAARPRRTKACWRRSRKRLAARRRAAACQPCSTSIARDADGELLGAAGRVDRAMRRAAGRRRSGLERGAGRRLPPASATASWPRSSRQGATTARPIPAGS